MLSIPGYWTQAQLIAWIMYQDLALVIDIGAEGWQGGKHLINDWAARRRAELEAKKESPLNQYNSLNQAASYAIIWLAHGNTVATGTKDGRGDRMPVPTIAWLSLKFTWSPDVAGPDNPNREGATTWHDLLFIQAHAMRRWQTEADIARSGSPPHTPEGHEWLADVFHRNIEPLGLEGLEAARRELAETRVVATLLDQFGRLVPVARRMWNKPDLELKVYPVIRSGRMRMRVNADAPASEPHDYAEGWVFVPVGAFAGGTAETKPQSAAPQEKPEPSTSGTPVKPTGAQWCEIEAWYCNTHVPQSRHLPRCGWKKDLADARARFPNMKITRKTIRKLRKAHAPKHWLLQGGGKRKAA